MTIWVLKVCQALGITIQCVHACNIMHTFFVSYIPETEQVIKNEIITYPLLPVLPLKIAVHSIRQ